MTSLLHILPNPVIMRTTRQGGSRHVVITVDENVIEPVRIMWRPLEYHSEVFSFNFLLPKSKTKDNYVVLKAGERLICEVRFSGFSSSQMWLDGLLFGTQYSSKPQMLSVALAPPPMEKTVVEHALKLFEGSALSQARPVTQADSNTDTCSTEFGLSETQEGVKAGGNACSTKGEEVPDSPSLGVSRLSTERLAAETRVKGNLVFLPGIGWCDSRGVVTSQSREVPSEPEEPKKKERERVDVPRAGLRGLEQLRASRRRDGKPSAKHNGRECKYGVHTFTMIAGQDNHQPLDFLSKFGKGEVSHVQGDDAAVSKLLVPGMKPRQTGQDEDDTVEPEEKPSAESSVNTYGLTSIQSMLEASPDASEAATRRLFDMIPRTPSPVYQYDTNSNALNEPGQRPVPCFFPFSEPENSSQMSQGFSVLGKDLNLHSQDQQHLSNLQSQVQQMGMNANGVGGNLSDPLMAMQAQMLLMQQLQLANSGNQQSNLNLPFIQGLHGVDLAAALGGALHSPSGLPTHRSGASGGLQGVAPTPSWMKSPSMNSSIPVQEGGSRLLAQIRSRNATGDMGLKLMEVAPEAYEFAQDQFGSRYLQQALETATHEERHAVFLAILPHTNKLTMDAFGNYVVQKLVEYLPLEHRRILAEQLLGDILRLSLHMYGCRVVQKVIELAEPEQQRLLASEIRGSVLRCVEDQNGNHVVQKCIEKLVLEDSSFIVQEFQGNVERMSLHCYGCRVVQRLIEKTAGTIMAEPLLAEVVASLPQLCYDQYGNYVVQHVMQHGAPVFQARIVSLAKDHLLEFACHKFASNVIEKVLIHGDARAKEGMIQSSLQGHASALEESVLLSMTKDRFGNYVAQKMLDLVSPGPSRDLLVEALKPHLFTLKKGTYSKHIAGMVEQMLEGEYRGISGGKGKGKGARGRMRGGEGAPGAVLC